MTKILRLFWVLIMGYGLYFIVSKEALIAKAGGALAVVICLLMLYLDYREKKTNTDKHRE